MIPTLRASRPVNATADEKIPVCSANFAGASSIKAYGLPSPLVVTLDRRADRWIQSQTHLAASGIDDPLRVSAVDGSLLTKADLETLLADPAAVDVPLDEYLQMTRPAVGCFLSHLSIWRGFLESGAPHVLIIEDDARPSYDFSPARARATLASMPDDTDILLLGGTIMDGLAEPTTDPSFLRTYYYNGTYAYLLTRKGCLALLPRLLPLRTHIDNQISLELVANRDAYRVYCAEPRLFDHDFTVWSDVYVPVTDAARADKTLAGVFDSSRVRLLGAGAKLLPRHQTT